jgi:DNA mismatch repair protein MutL
VATIRVLPDDLVDQIAAGEVVERPASVVKELIENAIDAGAKQIHVDVEGGGIGLLRVADDGIGMSADDAALAVQRHATSKVRERSDLERISTLGFRGEALPSIASVSRFSLLTRTKDAFAATEVRIDGGSPRSIVDGARAPGTTVTALDLFYNVPARRKFLKAPQTEATHIGDVVLRAALADPQLHLVMTRDGRRVRDLVPTRDLAQRARMLFPDERLSEIEGERDGVRVTAMLGPPERARSGANGLHLFVNSRPVRDRAIARAVSFAYGSVVPSGRFPTGVVWIEIDRSRVDVNVHPQKAEVRFDDPRAVLEAVTRALASGLGTTPFRASPPAPSGSRSPDFWADRIAGVISTREVAPVPYADPTPAIETVRDAPQPASLDPRGPFASLRVLGQAKRCYLVCEGESGLVIVDQHAADERVRFHRLRTAYDARAVPIQQLLLPERVELLPSEIAIAEQERGTLRELGLDVAVIGETTLAVRGVPAIISRASIERLARDVLAELARTGSRAFGDAIDTALATMACHGAIRSGDALSPTEQAELLRSLDAIDDFRGHCPHGRPIVMELPFTELARRVGR